MSRLAFFALLLSTGLVLALAFPHPEGAEDSGSPTEAATEATGSGGSEATTPAGGAFTTEQCKQYQAQCSTLNQNNLSDQQQQVNSTINSNQDQLNNAGQMGNNMNNMTNNTPVSNMTQGVPNQSQLPNQNQIPANQVQQVPQICTMAGIEQYCAMMDQQQQINNPMGMVNQTQINNFAPPMSTPMAIPMVPVGK